MISHSTEIPEWFSRPSPGSSITITVPSNLHDNSSWIGFALFSAVVIEKNLNSVSSSQDYKVFVNFISGSDMVEEGSVHCPQIINISEVLSEPFSRASSFEFMILILAKKL